MHTQIRKALELHEQLKQRMGVVIVGPSGSGKSAVWRLLKAAMTKRGEVVKDYTMNPKAMPRTHVRIKRYDCILEKLYSGASHSMPVAYPPPRPLPFF